jgi:hypothetical protein
MDPASIALAAAALIAAKASEGAGAALGDAVRAGVTRLYNAIRGRTADDQDLERSLEQLEANPASEPRAAVLAETLEGHLARDPEFAVEVERLINDIPQDDTSPASRFVTTVKDNAVVGKITNIGTIHGGAHF